MPLPERRVVSNVERPLPRPRPQLRSQPPPPPPPPPHLPLTRLHLCHPTPDLHTLGGAYVHNISRLERSAEEISQGGSDIASEIRKMNDAEKEVTLSRQASQRSNAVHDQVHTTPGRQSSLRSWEGNAQEYAGVSLNGHARRASGYLSSPTSSVHRAASGSVSSRIAPLVEPIHEGRPLDSPLAPSSASVYSVDRQLSRHASQSSQARRFDQLTMQINESFDPVSALPTTHETAAAEHVGAAPGLRLRPSTDTFQEAEVAFQDFDGVHYNPETEEYVELDVQGNEIRRVSARASSASLAASAAGPSTARARPMSYAGLPPPAADMVYYPAPVPRMLNLPKRLSQLPSAATQSNRKSQMIERLPPGARYPAPWQSQPSLSALDVAETAESPTGETHQNHSTPFLTHRTSAADLRKIPPQLRASVYFEHQPLSHDVEIQSESAVATLDNILLASANAPVNVFTDHPYAGDVRASVYAPGALQNKRSTMQLGALDVGSEDSSLEQHARRARSSSVGRLFRRSTGDLLGGTRRPSSRTSMLTDLGAGSHRLMKRKSNMSLGDQITSADSQDHPHVELEPPRPGTHSGLISHVQNAEELNDEDAEHPAYATQHAQSRTTRDNDLIDTDFKDAEDADDVEGEPIYAQPSTLLAELQVRKAQLKSRSKTAAMAFPNGMRSTLIQLDAVEAVRQANRKNHRVALAWEDPALQVEEDEQLGDDEDVPLGVLYPSRDGKATRGASASRASYRPLGLMEQRAIEDNEPLSSRRNRLRGYSPPRVEQPRAPVYSQVSLPAQAAAAELEAGDEHGDESLVYRQRRLKSKDALDGALSDIAPQNGERPLSTFTDDVLSQFGGLNVDEATQPAHPTAPPPSTTPAEEETLGQRRARLQREAAGTPAADSSRPLLRPSSSLANLLASHPVGARPGPVSHQPATGPFLHSPSRAQLRTSSFAHQSAAAYRPETSRSTGLVGTLANGRAPSGGFNGGIYNMNTGTAGIPNYDAAYANPHHYAPSPAPAAQPYATPHAATRSSTMLAASSPSTNPYFATQTPTSTLYPSYADLNQMQWQMQQQLWAMQQQQQQQQQQRQMQMQMQMHMSHQQQQQQHPAFQPQWSHAPPPTPHVYAAAAPAPVAGDGSHSAIDRWRLGVALQ